MFCGHSEKCCQAKKPAGTWLRRAALGSLNTAPRDVVLFWCNVSFSWRLRIKKRINPTKKVEHPNVPQPNLTYPTLPYPTLPYPTLPYPNLT